MRNVQLTICILTAVTSFASIVPSSAYEETQLNSDTWTKPFLGMSLLKDKDRSELTPFRQKFLIASDLISTGKFEEGQDCLEQATQMIPQMSEVQKRVAGMMLVSLLGSMYKNSVFTPAKNREFVAKKWFECTSQLSNKYLADKISAGHLLASIYIEQSESSKAEEILLPLMNIVHSERERRCRIEGLIEILACLYESNFRPQFAQECWNYLVVYNKAYQPGAYLSALFKYADFMLAHHMDNEANPVLTEILSEDSRSHENKNQGNSYVWSDIARRIENSQHNQFNGFYKVAFERAVNQPKTSSEYVPVAIEWATALVRQNEVDDAIVVIQKALDHARTVGKTNTYSESISLLSRMEANLNWLNLNQSPRLAKWLEQQRTNFELRKRRKQESEMKIYLGTPSKYPLELVRILLRNAHEAVSQGNCGDELDQLHAALSIYESNHSAAANACYEEFLDIGKKFTKCGKSQDGSEFLWRLVKRKMESGYPDPEFPTPSDRFYIEYPGGQKNALEELLAIEKPLRIGQNSSISQEPALFNLLKCARETNNSDNVLYVLAKFKAHYQELRQFDKLCDTCEQMETLRVTGSNPRKRILGLLDSANAFSQTHRYEKVVEKLTYALTLLSSTQVNDLPRSNEVTSRLQSFLTSSALELTKPEVAKLRSQIEAIVVANDTSEITDTKQHAKADMHASPFSVTLGPDTTTFTSVKPLLGPQLDLLAKEIQFRRP